MSKAGIAAVVLVYLEVAAFNLSWGPLCWLYLGEIFNNRTREIGVAVGAASQWLFNFMMSQITPYAIAGIKWRTFLMFGIFNWAIVLYSWVFLKEVCFSFSFQASYFSISPRVSYSCRILSAFMLS